MAIVITEPTNAATSFLLKILCNNVISGILAPAELIIRAITGPSAIPFATNTCEVGIMVERRIYNGIPISAASGTAHHLSPPKYVTIHSIGTSVKNSTNTCTNKEKRIYRFHQLKS